jgi:hypothetical protein
MTVHFSDVDVVLALKKDASLFSNFDAEHEVLCCTT